jgi:RimJ/RimL family protein N-acetyltransferase
MNFILTDGYSVSEINANDKAQLIKCLIDKEISENSLNIPYPYIRSDADSWVSFVQQKKEEFGKPVHFAIRSPANQLIGGIGFNSLTVSHKSEIGYWLAKDYWGKGITAKAVIKMCGYGFQEFNLSRIQALVFSFNDQSKSVLKKAGFEYEGLLKNWYLKNGKIFDGEMYSIVKI